MEKRNYQPVLPKVPVTVLGMLLCLSVLFSIEAWNAACSCNVIMFSLNPYFLHIHISGVFMFIIEEFDAKTLMSHL